MSSNSIFFPFFLFREVESPGEGCSPDEVHAFTKSSPLLRPPSLPLFRSFFRNRSRGQESSSLRVVCCAPTAPVASLHPRPCLASPTFLCREAGSPWSRMVVFYTALETGGSPVHQKWKLEGKVRHRKWEDGPWDP